jgi:hypothetical protein
VVDVSGVNARRVRQLFDWRWIAHPAKATTDESTATQPPVGSSSTETPSTDDGRLAREAAVALLAYEAPAIRRILAEHFVNPEHLAGAKLMLGLARDIEGSERQRAEVIDAITAQLAAYDGSAAISGDGIGEALPPFELRPTELGLRVGLGGAGDEEPNEDSTTPPSGVSDDPETNAPSTSPSEDASPSAGQGTPRPPKRKR